MKKLLCVILILLLAASFAACKKKDKETDSSSSAAASASQTASAAESDDNSKAAESMEALQNKLFKKGVWGVASDDGKAMALYYFTEDGKNCKHYTTDDDATVDFDYEATGKDNDYIFHITTYGNDVEASIVFLEPTHAALIWETLEQENILFITDKPFDEYLKSVDVNNITLK